MDPHLVQSLDWLLEEEGGFSNNKNDHGGATMYGVTQATYNDWRKKKGRPQQPVSRMTKDEGYELYQSEYWDTSGCDKLPWPISYLVFDGAVNSGPSRSVQWLQTALGLNADGVVGPKTIAAASRIIEAGDTKSLLSVVDNRVQFLAHLVKSQPSQATFLLGWWRRTLRILVRALLEETS